MGAIVFINGKFSDLKSATVSLLDNGYLYGDGIFETFRSYAGHIFNLELHLQRLLEGAKTTFLPVPLGPILLRRKIIQSLKKSGLMNASIRITLTRGVNDKSLYDMKFKRPTLSIIIRPFSGYPTGLYRKGIQTAILTSQRLCPGGENAHIKSCNYQKNILARFELNRLNCSEGILLNHKGHLAEGTVSNLFLVKKGVLFTPPLNSGCLNGITRQTILRLARKKVPLRVRQSPLRPKDLFGSEECFFTNSLMEILPAVKVGSKPIGNGTPGKITKMLHREYKNLISEFQKFG